MARRFAGRNIGLENEVVDQDIAEDLVQVEDGVDNLETELLEVQDSAKEGEERADAVEVAEDVIEELEEDVEVAQASLESGGLDKFAAAILMNSVNSKLATIGMAPVASFPAQESFGSASSRLGSTQIAIESITERVKAAWDAVIAAIKKAVNWVKGHFQSVFGAFERMKKRAAAVQDKADNVTGQAKERNFENDRVYNALSINRQVGGNFAHFKGTFEALRALLDAPAKQVADVRRAVEQVEKLNDDAKGFSVDIAKLVDIVTAGQAKDQIKSKENNVDGAEGKQSAELLGGVAVFAYTSEESTSRNRVRLGKSNPRAEKVEGKRLNTLSAADAAQIAQQIEILCDVAIGSRKSLDELASEKAKLVDKAEKLSKKDTTVTDKEGNTDVNATAEKRNNLRSLRADVMAVNRLVADFPAAVSTYFLNVSKSALDYAELSLKQYKD